MPLISPRSALTQFVQAVPEQCRANMIIIGSLAAGYQLLAGDGDMQVRTKDVDCLLRPRVEAVDAGRRVAEQLFQGGWKLRQEGDHGVAGDRDTPEAQLPALRLHPPDAPDTPESERWFIEMLTVPDEKADRKQSWLRMETSQGHFGLPSFGFLALTEHEPTMTELGVMVARPEMMALANLLENPRIGDKKMSGLIEGREIKRSNKDLGRVLAIARLSPDESLERWPSLWTDALRQKFPKDWLKLAATVGSGLRQLLADENESDLDEARHTCVNGLLVSQPPTVEQLRANGRRLLQDAVEPVEMEARENNPKENS